jgi:hypothetical protein
MTRAGASELTRIPQGARKSAAASVIPRTQAIERIERQSGRIISQLLPPFHLPPHPFIKRKDPKLTLRRPISQTPSRRRMPNNARQVNKTPSFFYHPFVESVQGGVLRVDSVGDEGVDEEGAVGVYFEDCFKVLQMGIYIQYARGEMDEECQYCTRGLSLSAQVPPRKIGIGTDLQLVRHLVRPRYVRVRSRTMNSPEKRSFGDDLQHLL